MWFNNGHFFDFMLRLFSMHDFLSCLSLSLSVGV